MATCNLPSHQDLYRVALHDVPVLPCIYMEIHVHSTLALRDQKEKKGEVTHPTIACIYKVAD